MVSLEDVIRWANSYGLEARASTGIDIRPHYTNGNNGSNGNNGNINLVATNDVHYVREQDGGPHDVLLCVQTGVTIDQNCGGTSIPLSQALAVSCNPAFANLGMKLGADALRTQAQKFGFGQKFLPEIGNSAASVFPATLDVPQTAQSAIGEFEVAATPLQMAMVAAGIANDGAVMTPYLVTDVRAPDLSVISSTTPKVASQAMSASNAKLLQQMMIGVVENGTGTRAQIPGVVIGGKTGTARTDASRNPYAWFVCWADDPSVAVAVFVQDAQIDATDIAGGRIAAPMARAIIQALR